MPFFRCGGAGIGLYLSEYMVSGWSYAASCEDVILGRELNDHESRKVRRELVSDCVTRHVDRVSLAQLQQVEAEERGLLAWPQRLLAIE